MEAIRTEYSRRKYLRKMLHKGDVVWVRSTRIQDTDEQDCVRMEVQQVHKHFVRLKGSDGQMHCFPFYEMMHILDGRKVTIGYYEGCGSAELEISRGVVFI